MIKTLSLGLMLCLLGLTTSSCGSTDTKPYCSTDNGGICDPPGFPFVVEAAFRSDACPSGGGIDCTAPLSQTTVNFTQPESGKLCMKGNVVGQNGFAWLLLQADQWNQSHMDIVDVFDAKALGINGLEFTIDTPPPAGMTLFATTTQHTHCTVPYDCYGDGWNLMTGPRSNLVKVIDKPGPVTALFTDFSRGDPNEVFDTSKLGHFIFVLGEGGYDFCISDLKFVDAKGIEVLPPATVDGGGTQVDAAGTQVDAVGTQVDAVGTTVDAVGTTVDAAGTQVDGGETQVDAGGTQG